MKYWVHENAYEEIEFSASDEENLYINIEYFGHDLRYANIEIPKEKVKQLIEFLKDNFLDNDK